jgi:CubicO group peptidase (beta-lactamase class C family)
MKSLHQVAILLAFLSLCGCNASDQVTQDSSVDWPTEGWSSSTPEQQGMDSDALATMLRTIKERDIGIDSVTIVRNGALVLDATIFPFRTGQKHPVYSCTKSVVSALIGIAIEDGAIESVDQPLVELLPDHIVSDSDSRKRDITLEHLLTMSSGLDCQDSYLYRWRGLDEMSRSTDWVQFVLDLPMAEEPGSHFEYCNGVSFLLSAIIQQTTGKNALRFAQERLFEPLGISDVTWESNPQGISIGWSELFLLPADMAKIGYLYLNEGHWDGKQIVPAAWVRASTESHISATLQDGYGYQWWIDSSGIYMALGYGGQFIFVVPEKEMVVIFTSDLPEEEFYLPQRLLEEHIIPAARANSPLAENPDGTAALLAMLEALATP